MSDTPDRSNEQAIIHRLFQWGEQQSLVRAMLLTSSRTNPAAPVDVLSDYDVVVVVTDIQPYLTDEDWLEDFGELLLVGAGIAASWDALFQTIELFRTVAVEVGDQLGYVYPYNTAQRVLAYLRKVQGMDRQAAPLGDRS
jgi:Streptomycin adenylyltransferase